MPQSVAVGSRPFAAATGGTEDCCVDVIPVATKPI